MKPGMSDPRVPALRHRLAGDARPRGARPAAPIHRRSVFDDAALEAAIKRFQERHGLTADGAIGPGTRAALNVPVSARIDQIRVNLERARWVLHEIKGDFVLVDVAGFYVSYFRDDEPVWTSRVIVGKDGRETPIFKSTITYVVFNPTWTIPPGILVKDKLPVLEARSRVPEAQPHPRASTRAGAKSIPRSVNWSQLRRGPPAALPVRQDPGHDNALGLVKIMFPNPYLVYLHDSPAKSLFDQDAAHRSARAASACSSRSSWRSWCSTIRCSGTRPRSTR